MIWAIVVAVIGGFGVGTLVVYASMLTHKAADLRAEIRVAAGRLHEGRELVGSLELPHLKRD